MNNMIILCYIYFSLFFTQANKQSFTLKETIINDINNLLDVVNPYFKLYRMVCDRIQANGVNDIKMRVS